MMRGIIRELDNFRYAVFDTMTGKQLSPEFTRYVDAFNWRQEHA